MTRISVFCQESSVHSPLPSARELLQSAHIIHWCAGARPGAIDKCRFCLSKPATWYGGLIWGWYSKKSSLSSYTLREILAPNLLGIHFTVWSDQKNLAYISQIQMLQNWSDGTSFFQSTDIWYILYSLSWTLTGLVCFSSRLLFIAVLQRHCKPRQLSNLAATKFVFFQLPWGLYSRRDISLAFVLRSNRYS